jgi:hypothetical protein
MVGSVFFMLSAIGAYVIPRTGYAVDLTLADRGTFAGALCFFIGALLMLTAFRQAAAAAAAAHSSDATAGAVAADDGR